ncbi:MAG: DUF5596 domain-containing protein [Oscillospiraceae bacterium]|nr:DUF5596 domain-containing protein [Oscillospiraceae bacterium]
MDYNYYFDKIELWEEGKKSFFDIHKKLEDAEFEGIMDKAFKEYDNGDKAFEAFMLPLVEKLGYPIEVLTTYFYVRISERTFDEYKRRGISENVFYDTMNEIAISSRLGFDRHDVYGIPQAPERPWDRLFLDCKLFRFERLQFEVFKAPVDTEIDGHKISKGEICINTHIQGYSPLREEDCEKSYALAREFFKKYFGIDTCVFFCVSWLLHPWLRESLSENSGIVKFQSKFKILEVTEMPQEVVQYVFFKKFDDPNLYPEDTTLRRLVKQRLIDSAPMGIALGVRL